MMNTLRLATQRNVHQFRHFHKCVIHRAEAAAAAAPAAEPLTVPPSSSLEKPVSPKIDKLATEITLLNLLEVAELSDLLKKRLNLPDAPVMMGGFAPMKAEEQEEEAPKVVKSSFAVKLTKFDQTKKVALIKEIKALLPDTNLVQAKKFVESAPVVVKADVSKEEADKLKEAITNAGGEVEIL